MAKSKKYTYHAQVERKNRIDFIKKNLGFGFEIAEDVFTSEHSYKPSRAVLTDTGVIKIYSLETGKFVTCFIATVGQGAKIYKRCFNVKFCPSWLMKTLNDNKILVDMQPE